jgi:predicted nucleotidyltransferase
MNSTLEIQPTFIALLSRRPTIQAVYLFGSYATGKAHIGSDIDIGLVVNGGRLAGDEKLDILAEAAGLGIDKIDLVCLDGSDIFLTYEVVRHNRVLYHQPSFYHPTFYSKALRQYLDFQSTLEVHRMALKKRLSKR